MPTVRIKRGTRAQLNAAASSSSLLSGELYLITDENRLAVGTSSSTYQAAAKSGEVVEYFGNVISSPTQPVDAGDGILWINTSSFGG
jgi:hypothetical protein